MRDFGRKSVLGTEEAGQSDPEGNPLVDLRGAGPTKSSTTVALEHAHSILLLTPLGGLASRRRDRQCTTGGARSLESKCASRCPLQIFA
eukprot:scaffold7780_cov267-Pinguiococcus_pyrenoidosus.AAC.7